MKSIQCSRHETSTSITPPVDNSIRQRNLEQIRISPNKFITERMNQNEKIRFPSYKLRLTKNPTQSGTIKLRKFNFSSQRPININIQNININNYNYYNQPILFKRRVNTAANDEHFPIITMTSPNENIVTEAGNKNKIKRIKLVDLKKLKIRSNENKSIKSVNINCNNLNVNNIDKKYQNKRIEVVEDNNDSFLDELVDLLRNVEVKDNIANTEANSNHNLLNESNEQSEIKINCDLINNNNYMARPQTSYGGLNDRKKKMRRNNVSAQPKMNH